MTQDKNRKPLAEGDTVELPDGRRGRVEHASVDGHLTVMVDDVLVAVAADKVIKMSNLSTCLSCSTSVAMDSLGRLEAHRHGGGWPCVGSGREVK